MGRDYRFRVLGLVFALSLGACGSSHTSATSTGAGGTTGVMPVSLVIGSAGGKIFASDGTSVEFPPGALAASTTITLTPDPTAPAPAPGVWVGTPFLFGPEGTQFAKPVTVTLTFSPSLVPKKDPQVVVETAPAGSTSYTSLGGTLTDATHVSAPTTHFSIFGPAAEPAAGTTTGGSPGTTGTASGGTGTGGATSTGTGTGSTTSAGTTTGSATGTTGGAQPCIGASGCAVVSVTNGPGDAGNGAGLCDYPFLSPVMVTASIANGNVVVPNQISFNFGSGIWTVGLTMTACPGPDGGQIPVQANVELNPTQGGQCSNSPYTAAGTIDFEPIGVGDAGLAGTFQVPLFGGMQGSFSFGQDPSLCDLPAAVDAGTPPEDAGATSCVSSNACLSDAGLLTGTGAFWLSAPGTFGENWCAGPLTDLSAVATLGSSQGSPQILVDFEQGAWTIEADLSCCPAGTGTLSATVSLYSSICDPSTPGNIALSAAPGTVIFTETDGGLQGWLTVDAGLISSASFTIPAP